MPPAAAADAAVVLLSHCFGFFFPLCNYSMYVTVK